VGRQPVSVLANQPIPNPTGGPTASNQPA
jgi:hypothetical protein